MVNTIEIRVLCMATMMVAAFSGLTGCGKTNDSSATKTEKVIAVKTVTVGTSDVSNQRNYTGTVKESFSLGVGFSGMGTVESVHIAEDQQVKRWQLLAVLSSTTAQNAVTVADATLKQAEDAYSRMKKMHDSGSLPDIKWVEVETGVQKAKSMQAIAQQQLADCRLYAPRSGIIATRNIEPGANVMPGTAAFKLVSIDKVEVKISIPENEIGSIATGQEAKIEVPALNGAAYSGKIMTKGVSANAISHTYEVRIAINNPLMQLMPGMVCKVRLNIENKEAAIVVPTQAVQKSHDGKAFVWLTDGSTAHRRFVETGELQNSGVEIIAGLADGETLITDGIAKISEGMRITVIH